MPNPSPKTSKKATFEEYLREQQPAVLDEEQWDQIALRLAPVSESYLRGLLRDSGLPLTPLVEGVRQSNLDELQRTLTALAEVYSQALASGDLMRAQRARETVASVRQHTGFAVRRLASTDPRRTEKEEVQEWLNIWLSHPSLFPEWVRLRRAGKPL